MIISNKFRFIFIDIIKTATTTIIEILRSIDKDIIIERHHNGTDSGLGSENIYNDKYKNYKIFTIIRNPYYWKISHFNNTKMNGVLTNYNKDHDLNIQTYKDFIEYLFKNRNMFNKTLSTKNMYFALQNDFIPKNLNIHFIKYERLNLIKKLIIYLQENFDINNIKDNNLYLNSSRSGDNEIKLEDYYDSNIYNKFNIIFEKDLSLYHTI